ncbi:MAG: prepilin-type N-terminal cleavage/methylation domain-containing protein [Erysipelothrix sp.]|jgi:type IV pilus assembly protein PilA|nr:prepilin-type N-terminal cleavage/methylation domain-containing protein [Erysipelothrix sp.]
MKKLLRNKKGFTLIELIVVILILAILAAILVPAILNYVQKARDSKDQANARSLYSEISIELASLEDEAELGTSDNFATINKKVTDAKCVVEDLGELTSGDSFVVECGSFKFDGTVISTE